MSAHLWPPPILPPPRSRYSAGRLAAATVGVIVFQLVAIAVVGNTAPVEPSPGVDVHWSSSAGPCTRDSTNLTVVNWTVSYSNWFGPAAYVVMTMAVQGHLVRFWSTYVPAGALDQQENGSLQMSCQAAFTFQIREFTTLRS